MAIKINSQINSQIYIQNVYAYPEYLRSHGEALPLRDTQFLDEAVPHALERLINHIKILMLETTIFHLSRYAQYHPDGKLSLRPDCLNKITRLLTPEFSLYTRAPLSIEEFRKLYDAIKVTAARTKLSNLHFFLSSVALLVDDTHIINISFYVKGGPKPEIRLLVKKSISSKDDSVYPPGTYSHYLLALEEKPEIIFSDGLRLPLGLPSVFCLETSGGAQYLQFVDICIDISDDSAWAIFKNMLRLESDSFFLPIQADHILSSNIIGLYASDGLPIPSEAHTHIDPHYTPESAIVRRAKKKLLSTGFGSDWTLAFAPEQALSKITDPSCITLIEIYNRRASRLNRTSQFPEEMSSPDDLDLLSFMMLKDKVARWHELLLIELIDTEALVRYISIEHMHKMALSPLYIHDHEYIVTTQNCLMMPDERHVIFLAEKNPKIADLIKQATLPNLLALQGALLEYYAPEAQRCIDAILQVKASQEALQQITKYHKLACFIIYSLPALFKIILRLEEPLCDVLLSTASALRKDLALRPFAQHSLSTRSKEATALSPGP
jgi:hypothetical protein